MVSARSPRQDQLNDGNAQRADSDGIGTLEASQPDAPRRSLRSLRTVVAGDDLIRPLRSSPPHHRPSPNLLVLAKNDPALQKRDTKKARGDRRRNGASIAKFRTRRPAHICETSRYRAVLKRPSYVTRWRRTGWLGRQDSNLCISDRNSRRLSARGVSTTIFSALFWSGVYRVERVARR
jgi:hypothetical protein